MESVNDFNYEPKLGVASLLLPEIYPIIVSSTIFIEPVQFSAPVLKLPIPPSLTVANSANVKPPQSVLDDSELEHFVDQQMNVNAK